MSPSPAATTSVLTTGTSTCFASGILTQFVTWLLVVLGWWIVSKQNDKREHRKEVRSDVTDAVEQIQGVEEMAHEYLLQTSGRTKEARTLELQLKSRLQRIALALRRLRDHEKIDAIA